MAFALFFVCLLTLPTEALLARVSAEAAQDAPWKKAAVLSTVFGRALSDSVSAGVPATQFAKAGQPETSSYEAYGQVQSLLIDTFAGGSSPDEAAIGKLLGNLRRQRGGEEFLVTLQDSLSNAHAEGKKLRVISDDAGGQRVEMYLIQFEHDGRCITIGRYPSWEHRSRKQVRQLQALLEGAERSQALEGMFMQYFAQSHTPDEFAKDTGAEVLVMFDTPMGTLRSAATMKAFGHEELVVLFIKTFLSVQRLHILGIAHTSDVTPDTVFVIGTPDDVDNWDIVLSPAILPSNPRDVEADVITSDIRELGSMLRFLLTREWPQDYQPVVDVYLAFGKAMEFGAFACLDEVSKELLDLRNFLNNPDVSYEQVMGKRINYLRRVVDTEVVAERNLKEA